MFISIHSHACMHTWAHFVSASLARVLKGFFSLHRMTLACKAMPFSPFNSFLRGGFGDGGRCLCLQSFSLLNPGVRASHREVDSVATFSDQWERPDGGPRWRSAGPPYWCQSPSLAPKANRARSFWNANLANRWENLEDVEPDPHLWGLKIW